MRSKSSRGIVKLSRTGLMRTLAGSATTAAGLGVALLFAFCTGFRFVRGVAAAAFAVGFADFFAAPVGVLTCFFIDWRPQ